MSRRVRLGLPEAQALGDGELRGQPELFERRTAHVEIADLAQAREATQAHELGHVPQHDEPRMLQAIEPIQAAQAAHRLQVQAGVVAAIERAQRRERLETVDSDVDETQAPRALQALQAGELDARHVALDEWTRQNVDRPAHHSQGLERGQIADLFGVDLQVAFDALAASQRFDLLRTFEVDRPPHRSIALARGPQRNELCLARDRGGAAGHAVAIEALEAGPTRARRVAARDAHRRRVAPGAQRRAEPMLGLEAARTRRPVRAAFNVIAEHAAHAA
jgi:hypothetical protein